MLFTRVTVIAALLATLGAPAACQPGQETNGQRMARGLPPLAPKFGRTLPGKRDDSTQTWGGGGHPKPSSTPYVPYSGRIEARGDQGRPLGTVQNCNDSSTIGGLDIHRNGESLQVSFSAPFSGKGPFDILSTNPVFPEPYYVGAAGSVDYSTLDPSSTNTIAFTNVQQTPPNSAPVASEFDETLVVLSSIWSIDRRTKELTAQYINPDGSQPPTVIAYDNAQNKIFFVSDIDTYNDGNDSPASAIKLYLVPEVGY